MASIKEFSSRLYQIVTVCAVLPIAAAAQTTPDSLKTSPDPLLGIPLGGSRSAVTSFLSSRGWTRTVDSIAGAVGKPSLFSGTIDGHVAEIIAMFGDGRDRMVNLVINLPASSPREFQSTFAWAFQRMEALRCRATLTADYRVQLDSIVGGKRVGIPDRANVSIPAPLAAGHSTVDAEGNTDWPTPSWLTSDGALGTRLSATVLGAESRWPYEVTVWTSTFFAVAGNPTTCPDTRAAVKEQFARALRPAATGETTPLDTLAVIAGPGVRGTVGTQNIRTGDLANDDIRTLTIVAARGSKVAYTLAADSGYERPVIMLDDDSVAMNGTITLSGDHELIVAAERAIAVGSANRKMYELLRQQLTARDPLAAFIAIECETERLLRVFPDSGEKLIDAAEQKAVDPARDAKALRRIDAAMGGHMFSGCTEDRKTYLKASQKTR
jgi:hypothetical protein